MSDLFDQEQDDNTDYLAVLTGPGAKFDRTKYATEAEMYQAIAKGKVHGDKTLDFQIKKNDELREFALEQKAESTAQAKFEELVTKYESLKDKEPQETPITGTPQQPTIDPNKIKEIAASAFLEMEAKKVADNNLATVESRLRERFGENAKTVLRDKMDSLSLSAEDIRQLAKKSPEAVLNVLGLYSQQQETYQTPPRSSTRSDSFKPQVDIRDAVYYEKMRIDKPKEYYGEKTSVQRLKDMDHPDFLRRYNERLRTNY